MPGPHKTETAGTQTFLLVRMKSAPADDKQMEWHV